MKKGLLKPLRYISQIFDDKEPEMQIGYPTDVKHVAHIGGDGPNMAAPAWMKEFHSAPLDTINQNGTPWGSQEFNAMAGVEDNPSGEMMPRPSRRSAEPTGNDAPRPRRSRRHQSEGTVSVNSPSEGSRRSSRRSRKKDGETSAGAGDLPAIPKQSRRRSKGSAGSMGSADSVRASRSKNPSSASDSATSRKPDGEGEDERL